MIIFFPLAARASNNDPQLYCQTGLEDRPPPPSLHQHYNRDYSQNSLGNKDYSQNSLGSKDYYHIAQPGNSGRPDIDPGDQMALAGNGNRDHSNSEQHHLSRPVIQQQHPPSTVKFYFYAKIIGYSGGHFSRPLGMGGYRSNSGWQIFEMIIQGISFRSVAF